MTRASSELTTSTSFHRGRRLPGRAHRLVAYAALGSLVLAACGGDDDDDSADSTSTTVAATLPPTTAARATTTTSPPTTTTTIAYVTEGATVVVANASGINGAAGRLSDRLAAVGFDMGDATNSSASVGQLATSQVYYVPESADALAVAESLQAALGGGDIELLEVGVPAPTESGELGDATVLVMMGNDVADKSLEELQGRVPQADDGDEGDDGDDETTDTTEATETTEATDDTTDDTTETTEG